jgi:hypothetical protein
LRLLPPFTGRARIGFQHRAADRGTDLPRRLPREVRDHQGLGGGRGGVVQHPGGLGDDLRLIGVDDALAQGAGGQW